MEAPEINTAEFVKEYLETHGIKPTPSNKRATELIMNNLSEDLLALVSSEVKEEVSNLKKAVQNIGLNVNAVHNRLAQVEGITENFQKFFAELIGSMSESNHAAVKTYTFLIGMAASYKDPVRAEMMRTAHDVLLFMLEHPETQKEVTNNGISD